jgi:diketogulonate reductase-like aldo/keto reductase
VRAVGVSNFGPGHLAGLKAAGRELPEANQVELSCWLQQRPLVEFCAREGIVVMAYSPLAKTWRFKKTPVAALAEQTGRTEAQLALRWSLEEGLVTIPNSTNRGRIAENAAVFDFAFDAGQRATMAAADEGFNTTKGYNLQTMPWDEIMVNTPAPGYMDRYPRHELDPRYGRE